MKSNYSNKNPNYVPHKLPNSLKPGKVNSFKGHNSLPDVKPGLKKLENIKFEFGLLQRFRFEVFD